MNTGEPSSLFRAGEKKIAWSRRSPNGVANESLLATTSNLG
jgi:hypothetical protein